MKSCSHISSFALFSFLWKIKQIGTVSWIGIFNNFQNLQCFTFWSRKKNCSKTYRISLYQKMYFNIKNCLAACWLRWNCFTVYKAPPNGEPSLIVFRMQGPCWTFLVYFSLIWFISIEKKKHCLQLTGGIRANYFGRLRVCGSKHSWAPYASSNAWFFS